MKNITFLDSIKCAVKGMKYAFKTEKNLVWDRCLESGIIFSDFKYFIKINKTGLHFIHNCNKWSFDG